MPQEGTLYGEYTASECTKCSSTTTKGFPGAIRHIAQAVRYLHDRTLIHRDIKPENLLLGSKHKLLLSDFGITIPAHQTDVYALRK